MTRHHPRRKRTVTRLASHSDLDFHATMAYLNARVDNFRSARMNWPKGIYAHASIISRINW